MGQERYLTIAAGVAKMTKPAIADWLVEHGTIYPTRAGLLAWSKDDLVSSMVEKVMLEVDRAGVGA